MCRNHYSLPCQFAIVSYRGRLVINVVRKYLLLSPELIIFAAGIFKYTLKIEKCIAHSN
jgi:hypothetical protein